MTNTNHNLWTLTKHVAVSVNKGAGKLDVKIYGGDPGPKVDAVIHMPTNKPSLPPKPVNPNAPTGFGVIFAIVVVGTALAYVFRKSFLYR